MERGRGREKGREQEDERYCEGNFLVLGKMKAMNTPISAYHSLFMTWTFLVH